MHHGLYHVLGGTLSAMSGIGPEDLNVAGLLTRIAEGDVAEVILALGATVDGAATAHWLTDQLRPTGVAVTRVGQGVPMGGALDVLDDGTLAAALRTTADDVIAVLNIPAGLRMNLSALPAVNQPDRMADRLGLPALASPVARPTPPPPSRPAPPARPVY